MGGYARKNAIVAGEPGESEDSGGDGRKAASAHPEGDSGAGRGERVPRLQVEELLSRAHVSLSIVRRGFGDKRGCYLTLLDHGVEEAKRRSAEAFAGSKGAWAEKATTAEAMELIRNACVKREELGKWRGTGAGERRGHGKRPSREGRARRERGPNRRLAHYPLEGMDCRAT
jgi:hypothetical protein